MPMSWIIKILSNKRQENKVTRKAIILHGAYVNTPYSICLTLLGKTMLVFMSEFKQYMHIDECLLICFFKFNDHSFKLSAQRHHVLIKATVFCIKVHCFKIEKNKYSASVEKTLMKCSASWPDIFHFQSKEVKNICTPASNMSNAFFSYP